MNLPPRARASRFLHLACLGVALATACRTAEPGPGPQATSAARVAATAAGDCGSGCRRVVPSPTYPDNPTAPPGATFGEGYSFSEDWFTRNVPVWKEHLTPLRGRAKLRYLEIGTFEGMSAIWMLQQVATGEGATVEGVDPCFSAEVKARLVKNIERTGQAARFTLHEGLSAAVLPKLTPESYDVAYIDGSHTADDVLADAVLTWLLLAPGGLLIFDDWQFDPKLPDELRPTVSVDAFLTAYRRRFELVHRGYQVIVKKLPFGGCNARPFCTPVGSGGYDFQQHRLEDAAGQEVPLADAERALLERLLTERRFGAARTEFVPEDIDRLGRPAVEALAKKVGLVLP